MEQAQSTWWRTMAELQTTLRYGALQLFLNEKLSRDQLHNYIMSGMTTGWPKKVSHYQMIKKY